jgi:hypothetical protein
MKHTQGPWQVGYAVDDYGDTEIIIEKITSSGSLLVAVAVGGLLGQEANARLMAAAPDLLKALQKFALKHRHTYGLDGAWDEEITMAEAAITKATGGTP